MKLNSLLATILVAWLSGSSTTVLAGPQNITAAEWARLPRYCPDTQRHGPYEANKGKWEAVMGPGFEHMHHYCWGLINFARAERATVTKEQKLYLRGVAEDDFLYIVKNTNDRFILLPEVLTWIGRTRLLRLKPDDANKAFAKARALKPDYWPAYTYWADFLLASGRKAEALAMVKLGLQHAPQSKALSELFRTLGGKPGDIPPPIANKADIPVTETPSPEQPGNPPVTAKDAQGQN